MEASAPLASHIEPEPREWQLPTPVPVHDFDRIPVFDGDPYPYGVPPATAPIVAPAGGAA